MQSDQRHGYHHLRAIHGHQRRMEFRRRNMQVSRTSPSLDIAYGNNNCNFSSCICRSLEVKYVGPKDYKGIHGYHFVADLGDMSTDPDLKCFCPTNDTCLKRGAFDVTKCTGSLSHYIPLFTYTSTSPSEVPKQFFSQLSGAPLILTLPHCYDCHVDYLNGVNGMNPDKELHSLYSTFEPVIVYSKTIKPIRNLGRYFISRLSSSAPQITGTPVAGKRRIQFNMFIQRIKKVNVMKELAEEPFLMPIFWVDEVKFKLL